MNKKWHSLLAGALLTTAIVAPIAEASTYTVQKGDTLTKIAKAHNTTIQQLKQFNSLESNNIYVQQKLVVATKGQVVTKPTVPTKTPTGTKPSITVSKAVEEETLAKSTAYKVVKGDNLTKIAKLFNVTVANVKQWNNLKSDNIFVGQTLTIQATTHTEQDENAMTAAEVEAVVDFVDKEISLADQQITTQLASEKAITTTPTQAAQTTYNEVIQLANALLGIPYVYGGNTTNGFDCSGFVQYVYSNAGFDVTRKSSLDYFLQDTTKVTQPVPGDVVFFKNTYMPNISHMGIYIGDDQFIHAGSRGTEIAKLNTAYWKERFVEFKRFTNI